MDINMMYEWFLANKFALIQAYLALIGFASIIVKLTPTLKDDAFFKKWIQFTGRYIALNRK